MERKNVVVTFSPGKRERRLLGEVLGDSGLVTFMDDLGDNGERRNALSSADILLSWNLPRELEEEDYAELGRVRFIQLLSAGADHVPYNSLHPGITIASNVGAYAGPMAEHVLGMTLCLAKNICLQHRRMQEGIFDHATENRSLRGKVCGIIGFGGIGKAVAEKMRCFGVKIYAINTSGATAEPVDYAGTLDDLAHVLGASDIVVISLPLNKATRGLIGERELAMMKPDAMLINVARGAIIDEKALYDHLRRNPDFFAGIDAWWFEPFGHGKFCTNYPFMDLPNLLGSPHNSAMGEGYLFEAAGRAAENILRYLTAGKVRGIVNREDYEDFELMKECSGKFFL